MQSHRTIALYV